jgi:hypothetical protein
MSIGPPATAASVRQMPQLRPDPFPLPCDSLPCLPPPPCLCVRPDVEPGQLRLLEVDERLVLPTNSLVRLLVTSADVIHSWAVPSLGVKIDAIPGRLNQVGADERDAPRMAGGGCKGAGCRSSSSNSNSRKWKLAGCLTWGASGIVSMLWMSSG